MAEALNTCKCLFHIYYNHINKECMHTQSTHSCKTTRQTNNTIRLYTPIQLTVCHQRCVFFLPRMAIFTNSFAVMVEAFVPCGGFIWMRGGKKKIILSQLNAIDNTETSCCENDKAIHILTHLWWGFGLPWERSTGGGSAEFPPPLHLSCQCLAEI